jgi:thiosulfate/3-mercaptopyruvate sulfurtransferase
VSAYIAPGWLEQHLGDPAVRIVESSIERATYDAAHIPGAAWVDAHREMLRHDDDSSGEVPTPRQYAALMSRLGITPEMTVVWYGDRHSSFAMRGFWMMDYYRHAGVCYVLEGGRERWTAEGRPLTADTTHVRATDYPEPTAVNRENQADLALVRDAISDPRKRILDVRDLGEYDGTSVRAKHGGHIPGAAHVTWTAATAGDNVLKTEAELRAMYEAQGVTPDKEIITHCQLGLRAAHTWFVLKHVLGYPSVRNYDGSWQEWGNRDDTPIER